MFYVYFSFIHFLLAHIFRSSRKIKIHEAVLALNQCLISVMDWMKVHELKLNPDQTEVLLVSQKAEKLLLK